MGLFAWREEYSVHHAPIDTQHKRLFLLAEELHTAMLRGEARAIMGEIFTRLIDYTRNHFRDEESVMAKAGYPHCDQHKAEHETLTAQVLELKKGFDQGDITVSVETLHFLRDWLERHIMVSDHKIGDYLAQRPSRQLMGAR